MKEFPLSGFVKAKFLTMTTKKEIKFKYNITMTSSVICSILFGYRSIWYYTIYVILSYMVFKLQRGWKGKHKYYTLNIYPISNSQSNICLFSFLNLLICLKTYNSPLSNFSPEYKVKYEENKAPDSSTIYGIVVSSSFNKKTFKNFNS